MVNQDQRRYARETPGVASPLAELVHHDDVAVAVTLAPLSVLTLLECHSDDGEFTLVRRTSTEPQFRIKSDALLPVPPPKFALDQEVGVLGTQPADAVRIHRIEWHAAREHEVYYVIHQGRLSGKRYLPEELIPLHQR